MTEFTSPAPITDPSLRAGNQHKIEPGVLALAQDPSSLTNPNERTHALAEADRLTEACGEMKMARNYEGLPCYAETREKVGDVFAFNGEVLQQPESTPNNEKNEKATHLIIETENGDMLMIRRKPDGSGFDIISTAAAGTESARRDIPDDALKDVVAIVGQPLALGEGFVHGAGGNIARITMVDMSQTLDLKPDSIILSDPDSQTDAVSRFGEAMRKKSIEHKPAAKTEPVREVLGTEAVEQLVAIAPNTTAEKHAYNPYEQFSDEKLERIRDSVIDSIKTGIRRYEPEDVALSIKNLMNIQRDLERRGVVPKPEHARGEEINGILYTTEVDSSIIANVMNYIDEIDGGIVIVAGLRNTVNTDSTEYLGGRTGSGFLDNLELYLFLDRVVKLYKNRHYPGEKDTQPIKTTNPYAAKKNEDLARLVATFEKSIKELLGSGNVEAAKELTLRLSQVNKVIEGRKN